MVGLTLAVVAAAAWATGNPEKIARGKEVYEIGCTSCHGKDGRGNPAWESDVRPVELDDCGTTAEPTQLWEAIVREGGASWGLSSVMPAFGEAFSDEEIGAAVAYMRTFCADADRYPPGDLNFRRLLATGKAFPEMEWVLRLSHRPESETRETELEVIYENRLGARFQYEVELPLRLEARAAGQGTGIGDLTLSGKQVLHHDLSGGTILSAGLDVRLPTGSETKGLGSGTVRLDPFLAFGKAWGRGRTIVQGRFGGRFPADGDKGDPQGAYAIALSRALGHPRVAWTPAVEVAGTLNFDTGRHDYAVWLETSKALNKLGHVIASVGVQIPIRPRDVATRVEFYLLWDFGDGPFWVGW
jgi:mono/diheme cytochrome c family protein